MSTKKNADITIFLLPPVIFTLNIYSIFLNSVLIADNLYDHHKYFYLDGTPFPVQALKKRTSAHRLTPFRPSLTLIAASGN